MSILDDVTEAVLATEAKILVIDIEMQPGRAYYWHPKSNGWIPPHMVIDKPSMLCFDAKWYGDRTHTFRSVWDDGPDEMVAEAHRLLDAADLVVGYNSAGFDVPHLFREMIVAGLTPPSPHKDIDLMRAAKRRFRFPYNSLNEVCRDLGLELKLDHDGFDLWVRCMDGDPAAQRKMRRYNRQDVVVTEQLFDVLRPWIPNHPNLNLYRGPSVSGCHACGSDQLEAAGFKYTQTRTYSQWRCLTCGAYSQATHSDRSHHRKGSQ